VAAAGTTSVLAVKPALAALEDAGLQGEGVLRRVGISREMLGAVENRLPYETTCEFWMAAAEAAGDACFGLHVAEKMPTGAYDVIEYIMSVAPTAGEGLRRVTEYVRLIYDRSNFRLVLEPGSARMVRRTPLPCLHYDEFTLALVLTRSRQATGVEWKPDRIGFVHERSEGREEVMRFFGTQVEYGQNATEMVFQPDVLALPQRHGDSRLLGILLRHADALLASLPNVGDIVARVSSSVARELSAGLPTLLSTAQALRMTPRTLQRQLARHGMSHSGILDDVRRGLAMKYIADASLSVGEIGYLLQFSDPTAFHRAFRRWTGEAPQHYRQKLFPTSRDVEPPLGVEASPK
jgi:AraC-like DNA-binding protein